MLLWGLLLTFVARNPAQSRKGRWNRDVYSGQKSITAVDDRNFSHDQLPYHGTGKETERRHAEAGLENMYMAPQPWPWPHGGACPIWYLCMDDCDGLASV